MKISDWSMLLKCLPRFIILPLIARERVQDVKTDCIVLIQKTFLLKTPETDTEGRNICGEVFLVGKF